MKANAEPHLLSSLLQIDSGVVVSQHHLESFSCNGMTSFMEFVEGQIFEGQIFPLHLFLARLALLLKLTAMADRKMYAAIASNQL